MSVLLRNRYALPLILVVILILMFCVEGGVFTIYKPGWEINAELVGSFVGLDELTREYFRFYTRSSVEFDVDEADYGRPNIRAKVSDIRESTPKWPYAPLENNYGNFTYITEYHEYIFDLQIQTVANVKCEHPAWQIPQWIHETAMPYEFRDNYHAGGSRIGKPYEGSILVRFSCSPWGFPDRTPPENYVFNGYWLGIMNAKVQETDQGTCIDLEQVHKGWVRDIQSIGSLVNMYEDDGTFADDYVAIPWDVTKVLDPDIKSSVIVELPINLLAGAWDRYDMWSEFGQGSIVEVRPVDVYVTYTVRMECLVTKEFEFRDPGLPANPSPIQPPKDWVPASEQSLLEKYAFWLIIAAIAIVGLVILSLIGFSVFRMLSGGRIRACKPYGGDYG